MRYLLVAFALFSMLWFTPTPCLAQSGGEQIVVIVPKEYLKTKRVELTVLGGWIPSNPFLTYFPIEGRLAFHLSEGFALEVTGGGYPPYIKNQINEDLKNRPHQLGIKLFEEQVFYANLDLLWTPVHGKLQLFGPGSIIYWEIFLQIGAGVTGVYDYERVGPNAREERNPLKMRPTFNFGIGNRLWFNRWFALRIDVREYLFQKQVGRGGLSQHTSLMIGFSVMFP